MFDPTKRRYARYSVNRPIVAERVYEDMSIGIRGRWQSFSQGGVGAQMSEQLRHGEVVRLALSPSLKVWATVRYCRAFYHGFEFVLVRDKQRDEISRLSRDLDAHCTYSPEQA